MISITFMDIIKGFVHEKNKTFKNAKLANWFQSLLDKAKFRIILNKKKQNI